MNKEEILAAARKLHDAEVGERHCDARYLRSCPKFAQAVLDAGKASRQTPERCGQRYDFPLFTSDTYTCSLAAGHRAGFHQDVENSATWSRADDLVKLTPSMGDLGGRVEVIDPPMVVPVGAVMDSATATAFNELVALASPSDAGALNLGPIIERQRYDWTKASPDAAYASAADVMPLVREVMRLRRPKPPTGPDATIRSAVAGISAQLDSMTAVFAELREAVDSSQLDAVRAVLRDAGLGYAPPADDVRDLAGQRDSHHEHADNCEGALARIADLARQALAAEPVGYSDALARIIAVTEENDR